MEAGISKMKSELKQHTKPQEWADKFLEKMKAFLAEGESKFKKLQDQYQLMDKKLKELSEYFCFDRKKIPMEELFGDISQFCKDFEVRVLKCAVCLSLRYWGWCCVCAESEEGEC